MLPLIRTFTRGIRPRRAARPVRRLELESLEARQLLHGGSNIFPQVILHTNVGDIPMQLRADAAPGTVENFLNYVHDGRYINSIFHRLAPGFVLQGGGFTTERTKLCDAGCVLADVDPEQFGEIETDPAIENEFKLSNVLATVAMAKVGGDPDSATSQFFINLKDNASNLDNQNGGFTVFAEVLDMTVANRVNTFPQSNLSSIFPAESELRALSQTPLDVTTSAEEIYLVVIESISGTAVLHGTFFNDWNNNGLKEASEPGVANMPVYLDVNDNGEQDEDEPSAMTDSGGAYHFAVDPGTHTVRVAGNPLSNFIGSTQASLEGATVEVQIGEDVTTPSFGYHYTGTSWHNPNLAADVNGDNIISPIDALIPINELVNRKVSAASGEEIGKLKSRTDPSISAADLSFLDVNNDTIVSPLDALIVINALPTSSNAPAAALSATATSTQIATPPADVTSTAVPWLGHLAGSPDTLESAVFKNVADRRDTGQDTLFHKRRDAWSNSLPHDRKSFVDAHSFSIARARTTGVHTAERDVHGSLRVDVLDRAWAAY